MAKNIKVKIDVDSNSVQIAGEETLSLVDKVKTLEAALKKVPEGTKEWSTLNAAYKNASADLDKLNIKSKELFNTLSTPQDVEIDIDVNTEEAEGKFVKLQTRIRETKIALQKAVEAGDTQSINKLRDELDELQDQFEKTATQSKKFEDALASVPGPAGMVGKAIKGIDDAFKFLIANPIVAAIAAIGAVLFGMYKALTQTKEGMAVLNKITDAFGNIIQQVVKVVSAIAIPIFEGFAKVIQFVSSAVADATGNYAAYQKELANDQAARVAEANAAKIKRVLDEQGYKYDEFTKKKIAADGAYNAKLKEINDSNDSDEEKRQRKRDAALTKNKAILDADAERNKLKADADKTAYDKSTAAAEKAFSAKIARMSSEDKLDEAKLEKLKQEALAIETTEKGKLAVEELYSKKKYELVKNNLLQLQSEYGKDTNEYRDYQTALINLDATRTQDLANEDEKRKKLREDDNKNLQEYLNMQEDIRIAAIQDDKIREDEEFVEKRRREKIAITANESFQKESAERQAEILQQFDDATEVKQKERREKRFQEEKDETAKHYSDLLQLLDIQGQNLIRGTRAYRDNRREILKVSEQQELNAIKVSADATIAEQERVEAARTAISEKYKKLRENLAIEEALALAQNISQGLNAAKGVADAILAVNENRMNEELKAAGEDEAKKEEIKKKYFEKNKKAQIALAIINTYQSAVAAFASMVSIPAVGPVLGAIAAAAAIVAGLANVAKIKASTYDGGGTGGGSTATAAPKLTMTPPEQPKAPKQEKSNVSAEGGIGNIVNRNASQMQSTTLQPKVSIDPKIKVNTSPNIAIDPKIKVNTSPNIAIDPNYVMNKTAATPNIGSAVSTTAAQAQATGNAVGQAVSNNERPIQTYVVGSQVSTQQQLDRRVSLAARMPG